MKEGWITKEINTACEVEYGTRVVRKRDGGTIYPVYGGGGATFFMDTYNREDALVIARFAMSEECTRFVEGKFFLNDSGLTVTPKNADEILPEFLNLQMLFLNDYIYSLSRGAAQRNLNVPAFRKTLINYPESLDEQHRIVSILDHCFEAIDKAKANAEQNLRNAKELFESYLQGVFDAKKSDDCGWIKNRLEELGVITSSKRIYKREYVENGIPFYRTKEVKELAHNREISLELFISRERYEEIKNAFGVPQIGDLLISAVGTIGEILVIKDAQEFYFKDGNIIWLKDFHNIDTDYLKYALTAFVEKIKSLAIGSAYSALTIEKLKLYEIAFPETIEKQQKIVQKLDALQAESLKLQSHYQNKIDDLEELKKSILQKAFAGELNTEKMVEETPLAPISESVCCEAEKI